MVNQKESAQGTSRKIAVLKLGTSTLTDGDGRIDRAFLADLAHQVNRVRASGWKVVIVSSGAVAAGLDEMSLPLVRPKDIPTVQAASSIGQRALSAAYDQVFSPYGIITSLVLLTRRDTADRNAYLHARDTFGRLLDFDVVPIVNENDTVSVEQIKFGDNDTLAALVACLVGADRVVILSDIDGLYTANPQKDLDARLIPHVERITPEIMAGASGAGSNVGSGGMITKLTAAQVLGAAGIPLVICHGRAQDAVIRALDPAPIGTLFSAAHKPHEITPRKLWIALGDSIRGRVVIDQGARFAIVEKGKSLLPVGIVSVEGDFSCEDVIDVVDEDGFVVGRGLARLDSAQLRCQVCGEASFAEVAIHRDDLVLFE